MKSVLNVGGGSKHIPIPPYYSGWNHVRLDIDSSCNPDVCMDALDLKSLPTGQYDAVFCSHNLEHYNRAEAARVLAGFVHVLKADGFAEVRVPDVMAVMQHAVRNNLDLDDTIYLAAAGPIMVRDVLYGYSVQIEQMNNPYYAHKTGFSKKSLVNTCSGLGFQSYAIMCHGPFELTIYLFKQPPSPDVMRMLGIPDQKADGAVQIG